MMQEITQETRRRKRNNQRVPFGQIAKCRSVFICNYKKEVTVKTVTSFYISFDFDD